MSIQLHISINLPKPNPQTLYYEHFFCCLVESHLLEPLTSQPETIFCTQILLHWLSQPSPRVCMFTVQLSVMQQLVTTEHV